ncbi:MAG: phage tail protein [Pseudomonadales bacterium]|nr:phage tail protein [Pseudomonadales bacterium]
MKSHYPVPAFHFSVRIGSESEEIAFRDVEGLHSHVAVEPASEGGENRFVQLVPTRVKNSPLVLSRGIGKTNSSLVRWCKETLEGGLAQRITTKPIYVTVVDENEESVQQWLFNNAYSVEWKLESLSAEGSEIAIEEVKFYRGNQTGHRFLRVGRFRA